MTALAVADLSLRLGAFTLGEISFALSSGEVMVVLGPNGAGKSVLLETIAGFHRPERGHIAIGGRDVTSLPPEKRHVGFVVQNFGLFPHLSVAQNIALATGVRRDGAVQSSNVDISALLRRFSIAHLADASPLRLSPGEKQRAALARAEASRPDLFLLDEPFAALDAQARGELRFELARFLREMSVAAMFVTHDYVDVAALGQYVGVMHEGRIIQTGRTEEVFRRPANRAAADILGFENQLVGMIDGRDGPFLRVRIDGQAVNAEANGRLAVGETCAVVRAEDVRLERSEGSLPSASENRFTGTVTVIQPLGALTKVALDCGFRLVACLMTRDAVRLGVAPGVVVSVVIAASDIHLVEA